MIRRLPLFAVCATPYVRLRALAAAITAVAMAVTLSCKRHERPPREAEIWLGGDVNLGDGGHTQLQGIAAMVSGAAGIINLEGAVAPAPGAGNFVLWNSPQAVNELADIGVRVAGIANNHALDLDPNGPRKSMDILRALGFLPAGGPAGAALLKINGVSIAITAHDLTNGVPPNLQSDLVAARRQADLLIATFHVTGPVSYLPRPELRQAVDIAYNAGAKVIASHGAHAVGPVERRGDTVIAWGLGNVAFACDCTEEEDAFLLRLRVKPGKVITADVLPLRAGLNNRPALPSADPDGVFDLLEAIDSAKLTRHGNSASF
ncbi:MAG TPA: CapA family protein [Candidatus Angelobacter sp.]|nr:CapA family protein [Candidatus Angelobacter sp.]